jgi:hypothetical protein
MRKRNHRHTRAKRNYSRRGNNDAAFENGLLRDQYTYGAKTKSFGLQSVRDASALR